MTLREISNAINGFEQLKKEQFQEYMIGVRKICYWTTSVWGGKTKELDIFPLEIDTEIRRAKIRSMKPIEVTYGQ